MMDGYGMGAGGWILMILTWAAILAIVGLLIVRLFPSRDDERPTGAGPARTPQELLDERLARGEIDVEEYERLRDALSVSGRR